MDFLRDCDSRGSSLEKSPVSSLSSEPSSLLSTRSNGTATTKGIGSQSQFFLFLAPCSVINQRQKVKMTRWHHISAILLAVQWPFISSSGSRTLNPSQFRGKCRLGYRYQVMMHFLFMPGFWTRGSHQTAQNIKMTFFRFFQENELLKICKYEKKVRGSKHA